MTKFDIHSPGHANSNESTKGSRHGKDRPPGLEQDWCPLVLRRQSRDILGAGYVGVIELRVRLSEGGGALRNSLRKGETTTERHQLYDKIVNLADMEIIYQGGADPKRMKITRVCRLLRLSC